MSMVPAPQVLPPDEAGAVVAAHAPLDNPSPFEWLVGQRLEKWNDSFESLGTYTVQDFAEVLEEDLNTMGMPALQKRRFFAAADKVPKIEKVVRAEDTVKELQARVDQLALLPQESATSYDPTALNSAAKAVATAASTISQQVMSPKQWLEDFRLELFNVNFDNIGVRDIVDFTEVLDQDLMSMAMPIIQRRRFRQHATEIPPAGGAMHRIDLCAGEQARSAPEGREQVETWLDVLRLARYGRTLSVLGVRELCDLREVREDDLIAMDMPLLHRRRFMMSAAVVLPHLPESPEAAVSQAQNASCGAITAQGWLDTLRLVHMWHTFEVLGCQDIVDFKEILREDLEDMGLPQLQTRRFQAAAQIIPEAPGLPGRRWEQPPKWLESLRLVRYAPEFQKIGVDSVIDFAEVLETDMLEMGMSPLQRRRFNSAVAQDAQPTLEGELVLGGAEDVPKGAVATLSTAEALKLTPGQWLKLIRCDAFLEDFVSFGITEVLDFPEVCDDDLISLGLPLLHRRRFTNATVQVQEVAFLEQDRNQSLGGNPPLETSEGPEGTLVVSEAPTLNPLQKFLKELRLDGFYCEFQELGVETVLDFKEVLADDLKAMGMQQIQRRRFLKAAETL